MFTLTVILLVVSLASWKEWSWLCATHFFKRTFIFIYISSHDYFTVHRHAFSLLELHFRKIIRFKLIFACEILSSQEKQSKKKQQKRKKNIFSFIQEESRLCAIIRGVFSTCCDVKTPGCSILVATSSLDLRNIFVSNIKWERTPPIY